MRIGRSQKFIVPTLALLDVSLTVAAFRLAYHVRFFSDLTLLFPVTKGIPDWAFYKYALVFIVPLWLFIFGHNNFYKRYFISTLDELLRIIRIVSVGVFFLVLSTFFYREFSYSRLTFLIFWALSIVLVFSGRELFKLLARTVLRTISGRENVLVAGKENRVLRTIIKKQPHLQVYYMPVSDEMEIDRIKQLLIEKNIDQLIFVHNEWSEKKLLDLYDWCENHRIDIKFVPDLVQICKGEVNIDSSLGIPIVHLRPISLNGFNFFFKRVMDLVISITVMSFIWPLLLLVAFLIKIDSSGPILFSHKRMGYRSRVFSFYKFRTMVQNADDLLEDLKKKSDRKGPVFKMTNDPRITKVGKILRRFSIDELPQLLNVLKGDMSLVGPRPQVLWEAAAYDDWAKRRLRTLPGITGLWQVSGRASLSYEEMIELDIYYIENWSCGMDLTIMFNTIPAVFNTKGAY